MLLNSNLNKRCASDVYYSGVKQKKAEDIIANTWITVSDCYINVTPDVWWMQIFTGSFTNASSYYLSSTFHDSTTNDTIAWAEIYQETTVPALTPAVYQRTLSQGMWRITENKKLTVKILSSISAPSVIDVEAVAYPLKLF